MNVAPQLRQALDVASEIAGQYQISSLESLLASCRSSLSQSEIAVAVVGRFKAGKSSFLNHFVGRPVLPVGVVPVTTVVTEIRYGAKERAEVRFLDGHVQEVPIETIGAYISERENPENLKLAEIVTIELPDLEKFRGLKFVDTPGLESVLAHNAEASLKWLPNVGLALVAVSVDPPLSQHDIELLKNLYRFTPNVSVILTKIDLLSPEERAEVTGFVSAQLARNFDPPPDVMAYSIRPGYEACKQQLERQLADQTLSRFGEQHRAILARKIGTLLTECSDYLTLSLKSAELLDSERAALKQQVIGEEEMVSDAKRELRLIVRDAMSSTRSAAMGRLEIHQREVEAHLFAGLQAEFESWAKSLARLLSCFETWLVRTLSVELAAVSLAERSRLSAPLYKTRTQVSRYLQTFRDRLSDRTMRAFGVPLRTTEVEIEIREPEAPDIAIGRVFDRNWELLSPIIPVFLIKSIVKRHFSRKIPYVVYMNLSRLASQWEESINGALLKLEREATGRLDALIATVERLIETGRGDRAPVIRRDLNRIESARGAIESCKETTKA
jgi:GTP-binding protein EngB required for normal cell division